jgi:tight adherence protein C
MGLLVLSTFFLALTTVITYYGYRVYSRPARVRERLAEVALIDVPDGSTVFGGEIFVRFIRMVGEKVPISPAEVGTTRRYLIAAGFRSESAVHVLFGCKVIAAVLFLILAFSLRGFFGVQSVRMLIILGAAIIGWMVPSWVVEHLVSRRHETLRLSLPDALDLMVVCVEAGMGLDQAFVNVGRDLRLTHKEICDELSLVNLEMRAGKRRVEALHNLAERTAEPEMQKLVAVLIQADRFGTSIADSLRTHADFMRIRRRQEAEERAGKVGVKLVFPIFFCILPAMLLVTAGPGLLQIVKYLFPMMRQFALQP